MSLWIFTVPIIILLLAVYLCKKYNIKFFKKIESSPDYNSDDDNDFY
jgi:hypothetical protein